MRIQVIYGTNADELTEFANEWLSKYESKYVIISISPAMPRERDGAYITIQYTQAEKIFSPVKDPRD